MMASAIAHSEAFSIAGGGDTLAAIAKFHICLLYTSDAADE